MKKVVLILAGVFVLSLTITSCSFLKKDSFPETKGSTSTSATKTYSTKDSLKKELADEVKKLKDDVNLSKDKIENLTTKIDELDNPWSMQNTLVIGALFLSIASIIVALWVYKDQLNKNKAIQLINEFIDDNSLLNIPQRLSKLEGEVFSRTTSYSPKLSASNANTEQLQNRINSLEDDFKKIKQQLEQSQNILNGQPERIAVNQYSKNGYAKLNSANFFMEILESKQETCVFAISFKSQDKGEFDLISLDKIKSRNGWQDVIEYTGNCIMAEATNYSVEKKGVCKKYDIDTWEVTEKLKIKISN